jgi:hypothetical protein
LWSSDPSSVVVSGSSGQWAALAKGNRATRAGARFSSGENGAARSAASPRGQRSGASRSEIGRSRRSARQHVMRRAPRLETCVGRMDPHRRATRPTDSSAQESSYLRASDPAPPARHALSGLQLDGRRMSCASGRPRAVNRREHRRTEQTDGEREWEKALAGEIHSAAVFRSGCNVGAAATKASCQRVRRTS